MFQNTGIPLYKKIFDNMYADPSNLVESVEVAMHKVRHEKYAYIEDATFLKIKAINDCNIKLIDETFYKSYFAFVVRKNWKYKKDFDHV